jgi:hypothetical protein
MVGDKKNLISSSISISRTVVKFDLNPALLNCHKLEWHQLIFNARRQTAPVQYRKKVLAATE